MKNPAILWYPSDFIASTVFWTNEQCGAYIRLLNYQFTVGHLTLDQMNQITSDSIVLNKFIKDENGLYYNQRLEKEIEKRNNYSLSRSKNKLGKTKSYENDMKNISKSYENHMGNENININNNINIIDYFNNNIHSIVPKEYEEITNWERTFNDDVIISAIDIAVMNNVRTMNYISTILRNWKDKGYKSLEDIKLEKRTSKYKNETPVPEWADKEIKRVNASKEELEYLEKEFEIFS